MHITVSSPFRPWSLGKAYRPSEGPPEERIARNGRLVKYVVDKTGLWLDQARPAAQATIDQLEKRMPAPLETQAESVPKND